MKSIGTRKVTKELIERHNFHIKKQFGQNFLTDRNILRNIVSQAQVDKDTIVVEIGPGLGALTEQLLEHAAHVLAYEIDTALVPILNEAFVDEAFTLIAGDILRQDVDADIAGLLVTKPRVIVVANLPYYITTPIILKLLEQSKRIKEYYVMMQLEVARRFTSMPRTKDYNSLSVFLQFKTDSEILMKVPKQVFHPAPNVDSAVVKMRVKDHFKRFPEDESLFYRLVRTAFSMRRKTLVNNLSAPMGVDKNTVENILVELGFSPKVRAEELNVGDFIDLADRFAHI